MVALSGALSRQAPLPPDVLGRSRYEQRTGRFGILAVSPSREKVLARADRHRVRFVRSPARVLAVECRRPIHLHALLVPVRILGISAYYHDSAACLLEDGRLVAAAQEERFTRRKHDAGFPSHAVAYCLREAGIGVGDLNLVGFYEKPLVKFARLLETYAACAPRGWRSYLMAMPLWLSEKLWMSDDIRGHLDGYEGEILFGEHHESHAASAFYPSPFEQAAIVTMDGVGEWATSSIGGGRGGDLEMLREIRFPHSLGLLYSAFTYFTGFRVNSGEYKVMGLAPYGEPKYVKAIKDHLLEIRDDGSLW